LYVGSCLLLVAPQLLAQERVTKDSAALTVDGVVREVFRSPRQGQTDVLVQIDVTRSEGRRAIPGTARSTFPGPGDTVYVHVVQPQAKAGLFGADGNTATLPSERAQVRAYLTPRATGGWDAVAGSWFELTSDRPAAAAASDPPPSPAGATTEVAASAGPSLGMTTEPLKVKDKLVLRVTSVERGGPAAAAGLEVGDVIIGAKGEPLTGPGQLADLARTTETIPLVTVDVRTGRASQIEFRPGKRAAEIAEPTATTTETKKVPTPSRSLGVSAEKVTLGQRSALKVIRVEPDSPAAKAGVEQGDVLVAADGAPLTGPEQLGTALRKSGPTLTLTVRDVRTGRDVPVRVELGGAPAVNPLPDLAPAGPAEKVGLGAVTELAFYDVELAVKVTEVTPGSPAARAGLEPGILILKANGNPVLHPNDLNEAVRTSTGKVKLSTVDPRSGRKAEVEISLAQ
jgi:S1-C subfamily serine protease